MIPQLPTTPPPMGSSYLLSERSLSVSGTQICKKGGETSSGGDAAQAGQGRRNSTLVSLKDLLSHVNLPWLTTKPAPGGQKQYTYSTSENNKHGNDCHQRRLLLVVLRLGATCSEQPRVPPRSTGGSNTKRSRSPPGHHPGQPLPNRDRRGQPACQAQRNAR